MRKQIFWLFICVVASVKSQFKSSAVLCPKKTEVTHLIFTIFTREAYNSDQLRQFSSVDATKAHRLSCDSGPNMTAQTCINFTKLHYKLWHVRFSAANMCKNFIHSIEKRLQAELMSDASNKNTSVGASPTRIYGCKLENCSISAHPRCLASMKQCKPQNNTIRLPQKNTQKMSMSFFGLEKLRNPEKKKTFLTPYLILFSWMPVSIYIVPSHLQVITENNIENTFT